MLEDWEAKLNSHRRNNIVVVLLRLLRNAERLECCCWVFCLFIFFPFSPSLFTARINRHAHTHMLREKARAPVRSEGVAASGRTECRFAARTRELASLASAVAAASLEPA